MTEPSTEVLVCERCKDEFPRPRPTGGKPRFCKPCAQESLREWKREWRKAEKAKGAAGVRVDTSGPLTCIDCQSDFERPAGPGCPPKRCTPCQAEAKRQQARKAQSTYRATRLVDRPAQYACRDCRGIFDRPETIGRLPLRCPPCKATLRKLYSAISNARRVWVPQPPKPRVPRWSDCETCGLKLKCHWAGRKFRWCKPCYLAKRRIAECAPRSEWVSYKCLDCDTSIRPNFHKREKLRCPPCRAARTKAMSRAWIEANYEHYLERQREAGHRRRARLRGVGYEKFRHREIYERDRWMCGICGRKINQKLKYPHPLSVSLDHRLPTIKGGYHSRSNVQASHLTCNNKKRANVAPPGMQIPLPI